MSILFPRKTRVSKSLIKRAAVAAGISLSLAGCTQAGGNAGLGDAFSLEPGKNDLGKSAKLVDNIALDSSIVGNFSRSVRAYGYVVEAKAGATITVSLNASAGGSATGVEPGQPLDTVLSLYGPYESRTQVGALIAEHDDQGDDLSPAPIQFEVPEDGRYLVAFSSWNDTGEDSPYELSVACEGTDFQCLRPTWNKPCSGERLYVQGGQVTTDTTWDACEVVLLENTTVAREATLTIRPGVTVRANYFGASGNTDNFGAVSLDVQGRLQAAGTAEHPIAFTNFVEGRGWRGVQLRGTENTISHAYIDHAQNALTMLGGSSGTFTDIVLEGTQGSQNGLFVNGSADATFVRALTKGFQWGLRFNGPESVRIEDSVIRENTSGGVYVQAGAARPSCSNAATRPPVQWRDPVIIHSDIVDNGGWGIMVDGDDALIQVEASNIINNRGGGFQLRGWQLHQDSYLRENNIYGNGTSRQVLTMHRTGTLDISWNYWKHISDPELSASWAFNCGGGSQPTGFSPELYSEAGPRVEALIEPVRNDCFVSRTGHDAQ